jgi:hypothetical protein
VKTECDTRTKFWRKEPGNRGAGQNFQRRHVLLSFCFYPHARHLTNTYIIFSISLSYEQRWAASFPLSLTAGDEELLPQAAGSPHSPSHRFGPAPHSPSSPQRQKLWVGAPSAAACLSYLCNAFVRLRHICGVSYRDATSTRRNRQRGKSSPDGGPLSLRYNFSPNSLSLSLYK